MSFISFQNLSCDKLRLALTFFCLLIIVFQPLMERFHPFTQCFHPFTLPFQPLMQLFQPLARGFHPFAWRKTTILSRRTSNFYAIKTILLLYPLSSGNVFIHSWAVFIHSRNLFNHSCNFFIHSLVERQQSYREDNQQ